jgi:hypothetical protein
MPNRGLAFSCALAIVGCTAMQKVEPARFIPEHKPAIVSVWTTPTQVTVVADPHIVGDSLSGTVFEQPWTVPLKGVLKVEANAPSPVKTALFVASSVSAVGVVYLIANGHGSDAPPCFPWLGCNGVKTAP